MGRLGIFIILLSVHAYTYSDDQVNSFDWLETLDMETEGSVRILYNKNVSTVLLKENESDGETTITALETKLSTKDNKTYVVEFSPGLSFDPTFSIYEKSNKANALFSATCLELILPGNGNIYISGHIDNMFNERRKFVLDHGSIREVKQPFLYVGTKDKTRADIYLYSSKDQKEVVAKLPRGTPIEVLLNDGDFYLIKSPFGLLGWYDARSHLPLGSEQKNPVPGIFMNGD